MHKAQQRQPSFTNHTSRIGTPLTLAQRLRNAILMVFKRELTLKHRLNIADLWLFKRGLTLAQRLQDRHPMVCVGRRHIFRFAGDLVEEKGCGDYSIIDQQGLPVLSDQFFGIAWVPRQSLA